VGDSDSSVLPAYMVGPNLATAPLDAATVPVQARITTTSAFWGTGRQLARALPKATPQRDALRFRKTEV
jgi:hypothetical protein